MAPWLIGTEFFTFQKMSASIFKSRSPTFLYFFFVMWRWSLLFLRGWCFGVADADCLKFELFFFPHPFQFFHLARTNVG